MIQSDLPYITDQLLNRFPFSYIVQHLSSPQKRALFERHLKIIFPLGSKESLEYKRIGVQRCRRSRATRIMSPLWPSHPTAGRSSRALMITRCGSGTPPRAQRCRRSRATRGRSPLWPSHPTAIYYLPYVCLIIG
jgi:hypothetical protein